MTCRLGGEGGCDDAGALHRAGAVLKRQLHGGGAHGDGRERVRDRCVGCLAGRDRANAEERDRAVGDADLGRAAERGDEIAEVGAHALSRRTPRAPCRIRRRED